MTNSRQSQQVPPDLIDHLNRGDCVLFVGDALESIGSQQAQLAAALVDACQAHCPFCQQAGKCQRPNACMTALATAAQQYESQFNRHALIDFARRYVETHTPLASPPIYAVLTRLPMRIVITTAYDDHLERAFRAAGRRVLAVVNDRDVPFDDPERVQIIYLHGALSQPESLVLTEDDVADLFVRLPTVTNILRGHFASKTLFFVGYGLVDPAFQTLYRQVTAPLGRLQRMAYALQWPPNPRATERWRNKVTLLETEPLPFLRQLVQPLPSPTKLPFTLPLPAEPYKFLDYFTRSDAAIFFGRELEADLLLSMILAHPLMLFYGRSGTGKTSLLLAKVLPMLETKGYQVAYARMLGEPTSEVKAAVRQVSADHLAYADRGRRLADLLVDALPPAGRLVVVLDQFEEFFIRQGLAVRQAFAQELADCLNNRDLNLNLRFVLSLRDDYLGALDELNAVLPHDVFAHRYRIENLTRDQALLAIQKPAAAFGLPIAENLLARLLADLFDQGLEPASLQIVLYQLYRDAVAGGHWSERDRQGTGLMVARYKALGETRGILAGYLDAVLQGLSTDEERQQAQAILKSMVTAEHTKSAVSSREIARGDLVARLGMIDETIDVRLAYLRHMRIVRKFGDEDRYELAHDVLVEKVWAWLNDDELRLLDVRDMLQRELSNYQKFGILLDVEKLTLVQEQREKLDLKPQMLELILRSILERQIPLDTWWHSQKSTARILTSLADRYVEKLGSEQVAEVKKAISCLVTLENPELVSRLSRMIVNGFPEGSERNLLQMQGMIQRNAVRTLSKMRTDVARTSLKQWIPTNSGLEAVLALIEPFARNEVVLSLEDDLASELAQKLAEKINYQSDSMLLEAVASYCETLMGRHALILHLQELVRDTVVLADFHRIIAKLPFRAVITRAYDRALQAGYEAMGKFVSVIVTDADVPFSRTDRTHILYLYGEISNPSSIIITYDDRQFVTDKQAQVMIYIQQLLLLNDVLMIGDVPPSLLPFIKRNTNRFSRPIYLVKETIGEFELRELRRYNIQVILCSPVDFYALLDWFIT